MESQFIINSQGNWFDENNLSFRMNEYDEYAVEQAVRLKEQLGGDPDITALSIGSGRVVDVLRKALAFGCDRGVHIVDPDSCAKDPWQIASMIAAFAQTEGFDLIFTGMQSQDRGSAQVGVIVAELLGISCVTTLIGFAYDNGVITVKRELEGGVKGVLKLKTPALVTCQLGLNVPRYPTLPNILKAKKKQLVAIPVGDMPHVRELTATCTIYRPRKKAGGLILEGDVGIVADRLMGILKECTMVMK